MEATDGHSGYQFPIFPLGIFPFAGHSEYNYLLGIYKNK
jgi:hypothetical protein